MNTVAEIKGVMSHAHGTSRYHRYSIFPWFPYLTDGVKALADMAECYWFLDIVGSYQNDLKIRQEYQVWTLEVDRSDDSAVVKGYIMGAEGNTLFMTQEIPYTDFPLDEVTVWVENGIVLLPSEH